MALPIPTPRRVAIPLSIAAAIIVPSVQAIFRLGLSPAEFGRAGDETLRAAPYAFSIWTVIYAGLIAYAAYQARPKAQDTPVLSAMAWPSVVAMLGSAAWIVVSALDWKWASVAVILVSAASAVFGVSRSAQKPPQPGDRLFALWPMGLLAGWLTIASAINILNVLTAKGLIAPDGALVAGLAGIVVVALLGAFLTVWTGLTAYAIPIAWGLLAVFVAERAHNFVSGWTALVGAALVAAVAAFVQLGADVASPRP